MSVFVLVVTSMQGLGELIKITLEEAGRFNVFLAEGEEEALRIAEVSRVDMLILDVDLENVDFPQFLYKLRARLPSAKYVLIAPEDERSFPWLVDWIPDGYLPKPFYLPDLISTLDQVLQTAPIRSFQLTDALQAFIRCVHQTSARFGLITHNGDVILNTTGISIKGAQEIAHLLAFHQNFNGGLQKMNLVRVFHIAELGEDFLLYTVPLTGGEFLSLAFDIQTPFSQVRGQANRLPAILTDSLHAGSLVEKQRYSQVDADSHEPPSVRSVR